MSDVRKPTEPELRLLAHLISRSTAPIDAEWRARLMVEPMADGGMGSLRLWMTPPTAADDRRFGHEVAECEFADDDNVVVSATLNIDQAGQLFELDIWKVNFSPLHRIPEAFQ